MVFPTHCVKEIKEVWSRIAISGDVSIPQGNSPSCYHSDRSGISSETLCSLSGRTIEFMFNANYLKKCWRGPRVAKDRGASPKDDPCSLMQPHAAAVQWRKANTFGYRFDVVDNRFWECNESQIEGVVWSVPPVEWWAARRSWDEVNDCMNGVHERIGDAADEPTIGNSYESSVRDD